MKRIRLPWAPRRWMTPVPSQPAATTSVTRDMPQLADGDRAALILEDLISLTVAMDVISTYTKHVTDDGTVLANLCERLRRFAALEHTNEEAGALLALAKSPAGRARALLSDRLARTVSRRSPDLMDTMPLTTPKSVGNAARRLEAAAELLIREAILRLATKDALDQRQL
jgi:hypothetical protein